MYVSVIQIRTGLTRFHDGLASFHQLRCGFELYTLVYIHRIRKELANSLAKKTKQQGVFFPHINQKGLVGGVLMNIWFDKKGCWQKKNTRRKRQAYIHFNGNFVISRNL